MKNNNIIDYNVFLQKRIEVVKAKKEAVLRQIALESVESGNLPTMAIVMNRLRDSGVEQELVNVGLWDKRILEVDHNSNDISAYLAGQE